MYHLKKILFWTSSLIPSINITLFCKNLKIFCRPINKNKIEGFLDQSLINEQHILSKNENEWQKTKPVLIPLPRPSSNFSNAKTRNKKSLIVGDNPIYLISNAN